MEVRPYQYEKISSEEFDLSSIYIPIDSKNWKRPRALSLENLNGVLNIKVVGEESVTSVEYINQEENPKLPPETFRVNTKTHIAVDENYIYVWVPSVSRWKRSILSQW